VDELFDGLGEFVEPRCRHPPLDLLPPAAPRPDARELDLPLRVRQAFGTSSRSRTLHPKGRLDERVGAKTRSRRICREIAFPRI